MTPPIATPAELPVRSAVAPKLALADGFVCPPGPRATVETCLAEHGFCARDVTSLEPALADLTAVITTGAIDCAGYYLLAADRGQWAPIKELHARRHHDPFERNLRLTKMTDTWQGEQRTTRIEYSLVPTDDPSMASSSADVCAWPAAGWPTCETVRIAP